MIIDIDNYNEPYNYVHNCKFLINQGRAFEMISLITKVNYFNVDTFEVKQRPVNINYTFPVL